MVAKKKSTKLCAISMAFLLAFTMWVPLSVSSETVDAAEENLIAIAESFNDAGTLYGGEEVLEEVSIILSDVYGSRLYGTKLAIGGAQYIADELAKYCDIAGVGTARAHYHPNNSDHERFPGTIYPNNHRIHGVVEFGTDNTTASIAVGRAVPAYDGDDLSEYGVAGNGAHISTNPGYVMVPGKFLDSTQGGFSGTFVDFGTLAADGTFDDSFADDFDTETDVFGTLRLDAPISAAAIGAFEEEIEALDNVGKLTGLYIASNIITTGSAGGGSWWNFTQNRSGDVAYAVPYVMSDLWKANTNVSAITMTKKELEKVAAAGAAGKITASYRQWPEFDYSAYGIIEAATDDPDLVILVSGHIDNVTAGYGVVDDGGAMATMVELARRLQGVDNGNIEIIFAAVGGEEHSDFNGAFWVIDKLLKERGRLPVTINMNMDQISAGNDPTWSANGNHGLNVAYGFDNAFQRGISLPLHLVVHNWVEFGTFSTQPDYVTTHRSNRSAHPGNDNAATGSEYIENFSMNHGGNRYYHSSLDAHDTPGNYGLDRHQYSTNLMHAAILRAIRDNVSKRAVFDFVESRDKVVVNLNDAETLFKTYDKITAEVVGGKDGATFDLEFTPDNTSVVLPAGKYEFTTDADGYTDYSGVVRTFPYQNVYGHLSTDLQNETLVEVGFAIAATMEPGYASKLVGEINAVEMPTVYAKIEGTRPVHFQDAIEYTLSLKEAVNILAIEVEFVVDSAMLSAVSFETLSGFKMLEEVNWTTNSDGSWTGNVRFGFQASGEDEYGYTAAPYTDVAKFIFDSQNLLGKAELVITSLDIAGFDERVGKVVYYNVELEAGTGVTVIHNVYDINKDGFVDLLDLGIMLLYVGYTEDDAQWNTLTKVNDVRGNPITAMNCDVNYDGEVDMADLIELMANFGLQGSFFSAAATVLMNGVVYTVEGDNWDKEPQQAVAVSKDGVILFVGSDVAVKKYIGRNTEVIDLDGDILMPSFGDGHVHIPGNALVQRYEIFLADVFTRADTLAKVRAFIEANPDLEAYFGRGFNMGIGEAGKGPRKEWLDQIFDDLGMARKPVVLISSDGHNRWLSSKALEVSGITRDTPTIPFEGAIVHKDDDGEPWGNLTDAHSLSRVPRVPYTEEQQLEARKFFQEYYLAWGITYLFEAGVHDMEEVNRLRKLEEDGDWILRTHMSLRGLREAVREGDPADLDDFVEDFVETILTANDDYDGRVLLLTAKSHNDGVVEGMTGYLSEPYHNYDVDVYGPDFVSEPYFDVETAKRVYARINSEGIPIHVHVTGDQGIEETVDAFEYSQAQSPDIEHRNSITHLHVVKDSDKERMGRLGIIGATQPYWAIKEPFWYDEVDEFLLGPDRAWLAYPMKSLIDAGVKITISGDHSVTPIVHPFWGIEAAVTRNLYGADLYGVPDITDWNDPTWLRNPLERITVKQAIEAHTINVAYQVFWEDEVGSLKAGKFADMIRIDKDPFKVNPIDLEHINILQTYLQGELVFEL